MEVSMARCLFVSRHAGAKRWLKEEGIEVDVVVDHLDVEVVSAGDVVIGTLPLPLAAEVIRRGARYLHLHLPLTEQTRGLELDAAEMRRLGARLEEYRVERIE